MVKEWALLLCKACTVAGIVEMLLPKAKTKQCIKTVLTIYILVAVFGGAANFDCVHLLNPAAVSLYEPNDYSDYTEKIAFEEIEKSIVKKLEENGITSALKVYAEDELLVAETDAPIPQQTQHMIVEELGIKLEFRLGNNNG